MSILVSEQTPHTGNSGDAMLVGAIAQGNEGALAEAYRRHGGRVLGLARRVCGPERAEEVTQDIFLKLWQLPERYRPERGALLSYLMAQAHGRAVDLIRSDAARKRRELTSSIDYSGQNGVEEEVLRDQLVEETSQLLARLPEGRRRPIELAYFGGHTYQEVAILLNEPEGTVKSRIRAGLAELRIELDRNRESDGGSGYSSAMPGTNDDISELDVTLSVVARSLFAAGGVEDTLQTIVDLAVASIDGCDLAGIFTTVDDHVETSVVSDPLVMDIDELQQESGEGPCLDALSSDATVYASDLIDDTRWPTFGPRAVDLGIRCTLALSLVANDTPGALNLYGRFPGAFGATDRAQAVIFSTMASLALSGARTQEEGDRRADNLHMALSTRELIGQAEGILMEREHVTSRQAFDILRRASQHLNIKLREVAQDLVDTGERPPSGKA